MAVSDSTLRALLSKARTIAVVGLSDNPERDSNQVSRYLKENGYRIIPVNPFIREALRERSYPSLLAIPTDVSVDIADIFRRSDQVPPVVDEAIERRIPTIWMQLGVESAEAAGRARAEGLTVLENLCIMQVHRRLGLGIRS
ncbi:MAG: CoA-binding protein [Thermoplasmata archaeon]